MGRSSGAPGDRPLDNVTPAYDFVVYPAGGQYVAEDKRGNRINNTGTELGAVLNKIWVNGRQGYVLVKKGSYNISIQANIPSYSGVIGEGMGVTNITLTAGSNKLPFKQLDTVSGSEGIWLKDFTLDLNGANQSSNGWIALAGVSHSVMTGIEVLNARSFMILWQAIGDALSGIHSRFNTITRNRFAGTQQTVIDMVILNVQDSYIAYNEFTGSASGSNYTLSAGRSMQRCDIVHNYVHDCGEMGIGLEDIIDCNVSYNTVYNCEDFGIFIKQLNVGVTAVSGLKCIGNTVYNCLVGIKCQDIIDSQVSGNHVYSTEDNGIIIIKDSLTALTNVKVQDNDVHGAGTYNGGSTSEDGINLGNLDAAIITGNHSYENTRDGLVLQAVTNSIVSNNTVYNNNQGAGNVSPRGSGIISPGGSPTGNLFLGNQCYDDQAIPTQLYPIYTANGNNNFASNNRVSGNSTNVITLAGAGSDKWNNPGDIVASEDVTTRLIFEPTAGATLADIGYRTGLTSQYAFAGNVNDSVGANNLTATGAPSYTTDGAFGQAIILDGSTQYLTASANTVFDMTTNDFTMSCWIYRPAFSGVTEYIISKRAATGAGYSVYLSGQRKIVAQFRGTGGTTFEATSASNIFANVWTQVAVTWDRTTDLVQVYINGEADGAAVSIAADTGSATNTETFTVGARSTAVDDKWNGRIDDLRMYAAASVTAANIAIIYGGVQQGATYFCTSTSGGITAGEFYALALENTGVRLFTVT